MGESLLFGAFFFLLLQSSPPFNVILILSFSLRYLPFFFAGTIIHLGHGLMGTFLNLICPITPFTSLVVDVHLGSGEFWRRLTPEYFC